MGKLNGKVAIVTGASSGIGEATVHALMGEGAKVVAAARRAERLEHLKAGVRERMRPIVAAGAPSSSVTGGAGFGVQESDIYTVIADVRRESDCVRLVSETIEQWGRVDILVNNAGVMLLGPIVGADTEDWRRMIDTNLYGLIYCTHEVLPHMRKQASGHIINISSTAGRMATLNGGVYNLTKWGVNGFSESLRQEVVKDRIRVTIIEPGVVKTELREHITVPDIKADINQWAESMTQLEAEDVADAIVYAITRPERVSINEVLMRPSEQQR